MKNLICLLSLIAVCFVTKAHGAQFVNPPSGSLIANLEGATNVSTLTCNVLNSGGFRTTTTWFVQNFRSQSDLVLISGDAFPDIFSFGGEQRDNDPNRTYLNELTFVNFTSELDGVTVFCGTAIDREQANFFLRVYRPPTLRDNFLVRVEENNGRVPVNLTMGTPAFPEPTFSWTRDGLPLTGPDLTYSSVTFDNVRRVDAGNYTVTATNFVLNSTTEQVGNDTGSFYLDVLYGPSLTQQGPAQRYVLLNDSLSLVCGTGLDSNPQAAITWMAPDGTTIMDNARYDLDNGTDFVRLNFTHTILSDTGTWRCSIVVMSEQYILSGGALVRQDPSRIGEAINVDIQLTVISPPGEPLALNAEVAGATSLLTDWEEPDNLNSPVSFYTVSARNLNSTGGMDEVVVRNTSTNATFFNVTGLLPGTTYELTVVAVSQGGEIVATSSPSNTAVGTTDVTVPALMCRDPQFENGGITVRWSYIHTGGLSLNNVSVLYTFEEGSTVSDPQTVPSVSAVATNVNVPRLDAGIRYTFTVTATNNIGSSYITCGPYFLTLGVPAQPSFGELTPGPNPGEVTIQIKTVASGVDSSSQGFQFNIIPVRDGVEGNVREFPRGNYQSGEFETLVVRELEQGQSYTFSATAMNFYGTSEVQNSAFVTAGGPRPPTEPPQTDSNSAGIIGGAIGGALAVVVIVAIIVIIIVVILIVLNRSGGDYRPNKAERVRYEPAPSSESTVKIQEVTVDIGQEMQPKSNEEQEIQYAELESFRPPSQMKNGAKSEPKPVQPEEPVEYAIITNFKKVEDPPSVPQPTSPTPADDADKAGTSTTLV